MAGGLGGVEDKFSIGFSPRTKVNNYGKLIDPFKGILDLENTTAILNAGCLATDAAGLCDAYTGGGFNDWYLPSIQEMNMIWNNLYYINKTVSNTIGGIEIGQEYFSIDTFQREIYERLVAQYASQDYA